MAAASWFCLAPHQWVCNRFHTALRFEIWLHPVPCWHKLHLPGRECSAAWGFLLAPDAVALSGLTFIVLRPSISHLSCATFQLEAEQSLLPGVLCKGVALPIYSGPCICSGNWQKHSVSIYSVLDQKYLFCYTLLHVYKVITQFLKV